MVVRERLPCWLTARPNDGMLATLGYRVGSMNGEKGLSVGILKHLIERQIPMVGSPAYTEEWGAPK
jgi:hypothetical protein